jgi:hypothetical protein
MLCPVIINYHKALVLLGCAEVMDTWVVSPVQAEQGRTFLWHRS